MSGICKGTVWGTEMEKSPVLTMYLLTCSRNGLLTRLMLSCTHTCTCWLAHILAHLITCLLTLSRVLTCSSAYTGFLKYLLTGLMLTFLLSYLVRHFLAYFLFRGKWGPECRVWQWDGQQLFGPLWVGRTIAAVPATIADLLGLHLLPPPSG